MAAILVLVGLPIAFSITVVFLMAATTHSMPLVTAVALIVGMLSIIVGASWWSRRLENE